MYDIHTFLIEESLSKHHLDILRIDSTIVVLDVVTECYSRTYE